MPLFGNKFSPKQGMPRKSASMSNLNLDSTEKQTAFGLDYGPIKLRLGEQELSFTDGQWISEKGGGGNQGEVMRLRKQNTQLQEENNLLKVKMEIMLDMLAHATAEVHLHANEVDNLRKMVKHGSKG